MVSARLSNRRSEPPGSFGWIFPQIPVVCPAHRRTNWLPMPDCWRSASSTSGGTTPQRMAACLAADPNPQRGQSLISMLRQRVFGVLAGGFTRTCNGPDTLRRSGVQAHRRAFCPGTPPLASQPTLSRFENLATPRVLQETHRLQHRHHRHRTAPGGITAASSPPRSPLDLDATDDPTHGHQQLTFFHGYFGQYQYFPLIISRADHQACVLSRGCGPARCMPVPPSAPMMTSCGWSRPCGSNGPTSSYMCVPTPDFSLPRMYEGSANKTTPHLHLRLCHQPPAQDTHGRTDGNRPLTDINKRREAATVRLL